MNNIIYCKDCKYCEAGLDEKGTQFYKCLAGHSYGGTTPMDFCSHAESRKISKIINDLNAAASYGLAYNLSNVPVSVDTIVKIIEYLKGIENDE